jgi:hypothetical protein
VGDVRSASGGVKLKPSARKRGCAPMEMVIGPQIKSALRFRRAPRRQPSPRTADYACDCAAKKRRCKYVFRNRKVTSGN